MSVYSRRELLAMAALPLASFIPKPESHPIFRKGIICWGAAPDAWKCVADGFPGKWEYIGRGGHPAPGSRLWIDKYEIHPILGHEKWMCVEAGWPGRWKRIYGREDETRAMMQRLIVRGSENKDRYIHYINTHYNGEWI